MPDQYVVKSAFNSAADQFNGSGKVPLVFDIYAPDRVTSVLPDDLKLVLHVNPQSMTWTYSKQTERTQTLGGFVEAHWGQVPTEISATAVTGGFVRLFSGMSNVTGVTPSNDQIVPASMAATSLGGTRRDSISYDKFLDLLCLFNDNGAVYDTYGNIAFQGQIMMAYDGAAWWGWFTTFEVEETVEKPYQFSLTFGFTVERETHRVRGLSVPTPEGPRDGGVSSTPSNVPVNPPTTGPLADGGWEILTGPDSLGAPFTEEQLANGTTPQPQPPTPRSHRGHR